MPRVNERVISYLVGYWLHNCKQNQGNQGSL